jgi:hypothetical protein
LLFRWLPWKFLIGRAARAYGVLDPVRLLARLRSFSQPSEVQEPIELLRAGIIFQARGLINARVIQYNLDWIWPYWVEKQYNPLDPSFVPRSFSFGHVNLTQRSWTAAGRPDLPVYPIVDPHGLITPMYDGWSLDFWLLQIDGPDIVPSKLRHVHQQVHFTPHFTVRTRAEAQGGVLTSEAWLEIEADLPALQIRVEGRSESGGRLIVSIRPYNPEGISFIGHIGFNHEQLSWRVNKSTLIGMDHAPHQVLFSDYKRGDVYNMLFGRKKARMQSAQCPLGLMTSAAVFDAAPGVPQVVRLTVPMARELQREDPHRRYIRHRAVVPETVLCRAVLPDARLQFLYDNAVHTLLMLSAGDIYPGPFTYKRFWFRDGSLMLHPLLCIGMIDRARRLLHRFVEKQRPDGYFRSQDGEWDSNGQVLWIMERFRQFSGRNLPAHWRQAMLKGARWIMAKRLPPGEARHSGLLPAGFSAEHLGPNDFYFWDNFWAIAGLHATARAMELSGSEVLAAELAEAAEAYLARVRGCITDIDPAQSRGGIPASPYRRMDAGAIGSMVADYPLQLTPPADPRIWSTLEHLMANHFVAGGFFQDMIHSGINPYLTLALAQTLLRGGDSRFAVLLHTVASIASPTGNWPEAVHPFSGGGCMGDGQHGWAAAEWIMMIRNMFVREEGSRLIIGSGILSEWLDGSHQLEFGPAGTPHGTIHMVLHRQGQGANLDLTCNWRNGPMPVDIRIPGFQPEHLVAPETLNTILLSAAN